jgi:plasmid stabilization system protein ParE
MKYRVIIETAAWQDIDEAFTWLQKRVPEYTVRWFNTLEGAIRSLASHPERCPVAPESEELDHEIRQLLHGRRSGRYRVLFEIRRTSVHILHVRHGKRRRIGEQGSDE